MPSGAVGLPSPFLDGRPGCPGLRGEAAGLGLSRALVKVRESSAVSWPGLDTLVAIREITGLSPYIRTARTKPFSCQQLAYRLRTLQAGDTSARWEAPPAE